MPQPDIKRIHGLKKALPLGAILAIQVKTKHPYQLVYRTLTGKIRVWDDRHDTVIAEAERLIAEAGIVLNE